ncbi:putative monovalent cation/H+ antiporter subunit D [compost metagenome]
MMVAKMWSEVFWKDASTEAPVTDAFKPLSALKKTMLVLPIGILAMTTLFIGLNAEMVIRVAEQIGNEMLDTSPYIKAVLGK